MKKTFLELNQIDAVVGKLYRKNPELKDSKFGYAYNRFHELNLKPTQKKLQQEADDLFVKHALEDKDTKALLKDNNGAYQYSKEGQLTLNKEQRDLIEKYESLQIEIQPYIATYAPELSDEDFELLEGCLVSRETPRETAKIDPEKDAVVQVDTDSSKKK